MRVWTRQPWNVWLYLKKHGIFYADESKSRFLYWNGKLMEKRFLDAYRWMDQQIKERISLPPKGVTTPIWCWYTQEEPGEINRTIEFPNQVWLELEIPKERILLSSFDLWHCVLGNFPIYEETEDYDEKYVNDIDKLPEAEQRQLIEQSWEKIFDVKDDDKWLQGCMWELKYDDVVKVIHHHDNHRLKIFTPKKKKFN